MILDLEYYPERGWRAWVKRLLGLPLRRKTIRAEFRESYQGLPVEYPEMFQEVSPGHGQ